jgi:hypothetical protein
LAHRLHGCKTDIPGTVLYGFSKTELVVYALGKDAKEGGARVKI